MSCGFSDDIDFSAEEEILDAIINRAKPKTILALLETTLTRKYTQRMEKRELVKKSFFTRLFTSLCGDSSDLPDEAESFLRDTMYFLQHKPKWKSMKKITYINQKLSFQIHHFKNKFMIRLHKCLDRYVNPNKKNPWQELENTSCDDYRNKKSKNRMRDYSINDDFSSEDDDSTDAESSIEDNNDEDDNDENLNPRLNQDDNLGKDSQKQILDGIETGNDNNEASKSDSDSKTVSNNKKNQVPAKKLNQKKDKTTVETEKSSESKNPNDSAVKPLNENKAENSTNEAKPKKSSEKNAESKDSAPGNEAEGTIKT